MVLDFADETSIVQTRFPTTSLMLLRRGLGEDPTRALADVVPATANWLIEAFSAQALGVLRELPNQLDGFVVPDDKLTPNGGAVAIGHPFGATGTRYLLTLATELAERGARYGGIGICIGSGQAVAVVLENVGSA